MKKIICHVLFLLPISSFAQAVEVIKFSYIESLMKSGDDTTFIINFWASWCKPCVKELPAFDELNSKYSGKNLKVILVSIDFKRELETRLVPFITEKQIKSKIVLLDDIDYNSWIDKVDASWGGAIPATLVFNSKRKVKQFYEKEFTFDELQQIVKPLIN